MPELHQGGASVGRDGSVTLTRVFRINTGNAAARPSWSVVSIGINKYDPHPDDPTCLATDVSSSPVADCLGYFDVTYTYSNRPFDPATTDSGSEPGGTDPTIQPNPTLRTPTISWSTNTRMVPWTVDVDGAALASSSGQPYEGLEIESMTGVITFSFNAAANTDIAAKQLAYVNKVNDADFTIATTVGAYPAGTLRCNSWTGSLQYEADFGWYKQCQVELEWMDGGWSRLLLDQGMYVLNSPEPGQYVYQKIINPTNGMPVDSPVKLNGQGAVLTPGTTVPGAPPLGGEPWVVTDNGQPTVSVYRRFYPYEWVSFTNIFA